MEYRILGKTGLKLSVVSLGGLKLRNVEQDKVTAIIRRAVEGGMNYIDTARNYGQSEIRIGQALKELGMREKVYISSKVIRRELNEFKQDFATTLNNLQTDYLDILFLHDISTLPNWNKVCGNGVLDYFKSLKEQGCVKHLGISTHDCGMAKILLETGIFEAVMLAYNPINREIEKDILPLCKKLNIGVIIMKPLGGGILSLERSRELGFETTAKECLTFAATNPYITCIIPGLDKLTYVDTALEVANSGATMTAEKRDELSARVNLQGRNYCRGCGYCLPCPQGIPIPTVLQLYNRWEVFGGIDWAQMHKIATEYTEKVPDDMIADNCIACGSCVKRCPYSLEIPSLMDLAAQKLRRYKKA